MQGRSTRRGTARRRRAHKKILVFGYLPFAKRQANVSGDIADSFDGLKIGGLEIRAVRIPVIWGAPLEQLRKAMKVIKDEGQTVFAILGLGETDEKKPKVERRANNNRGSGPDEDTPPKAPGGKTVKDGPSDYTSPLADDIMKCLKDAKIDFTDSSDAGRYLCEEGFYSAMHLTSPKQGQAGNGTFVHLPKYPKSDKDSQDPDNTVHRRRLKQSVQKILECVAALDP